MANEINKDEFTVQVAPYNEETGTHLARIFTLDGQYTGAHGIGSTEESATDSAWETLTFLVNDYKAESAGYTEVSDEGPGVDDDPEDPQPKTRRKK